MSQNRSIGKDDNLPWVKIDYIPSVVDKSDLHPNKKLLSDERIAALIKNKDKLQIGRNKKADIGTLFDVSYIKNQFFAIYKGVTSQKQLDSGAYGTVKLAQNIITGDWVPLKIIKSPKNMDAVLTEAKMLRRFKKGFGAYKRINKQGNLQAEILMELAPGIKLSSYHSKECLLSTVEYIEIILSILTLFNDLHAACVLHRDIKNSNLMLELTTFTLTAIDFGLAVNMNEPGKYVSPHGGTGTPGYMAPEICNLEGGSVAYKIEFVLALTP